MSGGNLRVRLARLERKRQGLPGRSHDHGWGQSREELERHFKELPRTVARRAVELRRELYDRGGWPELVLDKVSGIEREAHIVAVTSLFGPDAVPAEWREYPDPPMPPKMVAVMQKLVEQVQREDARGEIPPLSEEEKQEQDSLELFRQLYAQANEREEQ